MLIQFIKKIADALNVDYYTLIDDSPDYQIDDQPFFTYLERMSPSGLFFMAIAGAEDAVVLFPASRGSTPRIALDVQIKKERKLKE